MKVILSRIRFSTRTSTRRDADTDSRVELWYFLPQFWFNDTVRGWPSRDIFHVWNLDSSRDDRELGQLDEFTFEIPDREDDSTAVLSSDGYFSRSGGRYFDSIEAVRRSPFYLRIVGSDLWQIRSYHLLGEFSSAESIGRPNHFPYYGWHTLASSNDILNLSTNKSEGSEWHEIQIDGALDLLAAARDGELIPRRVAAKKKLRKRSRQARK